MADHVRATPIVAAAQPAREPQRRGHLARVAEDLGVAEADVLDPDRGVVQPDGVAAHDRAPDELVDRAVRSITKCAHVPGSSCSSESGRSGANVLYVCCEVSTSPCSARRSPSGRAAGTSRSRSGGSRRPPSRASALRAERDRPLDDRRLRRGGGERAGEDGEHAVNLDMPRARSELRAGARRAHIPCGRFTGGGGSPSAYHALGRGRRRGAARPCRRAGRRQRAQWVGLGDSFAAGPLIPNQSLFPLGCLRSDRNYARLAARYRRRDARRRLVQRRDGRRT